MNQDRQDDQYSTSPAWRDSAPHRQRIREMLVQTAGNRQSDLCIWGAGPCNDLDLQTLLRYFRHITLVDLDTRTLQKALQLRGLDQSDQVTALGGVDLGGITDLVTKYRNRGGKSLKQIQQTARRHEPKLPGPFDMVVSTCLLSQICLELVRALEDQPHQMIETLRIVRQRHLELMLQNTRPGGFAILVTDVTSSDALPELLDPQADLDRLLQDTICRGNHFHGLNPLAIYQTIQQESAIADQVAGSQVSRPWIWNATARSYCCLAFLMHKRSAS